MARASARASTMVNAVPSQVEGWHAPAGRRTCETLASDPGQADQTGNAGGCQKNWDPADRSFRKTTRYGVSRLGGQAGTQAPDPTRPSPQDQGSRAGSVIHTLPAESGAGPWPGHSPARASFCVPAEPVQRLAVPGRVTGFEPAASPP